MAHTKITTRNITDDAVTSAKLDTNITIAGTLASTGVLTANAGVVVDNITIDGTEIDLSSGNLTLDVAGTIKLDADGGEVQFLDAGTEIGVVSMGSSNMNIESKVADKDILFKGVDGSSDVTALTLDMSAAGAATFNSSVRGSIINAGTSSSVGVGAATADANVAELGPGYLNLGRDDTADAAQIKFSKNGASHSYIETRTNGLGFITDVGDFKFEGGTVEIDGLSNYTGLMVKGTGASRPSVKFSNATQGQLAQIYGTEGQALVIGTGTSSVTGIQVDSSQRVTMPGQPCFSAALPAATATGNVIVWGGEHLDIGGHFNTSNGRFTAPVSGNYYFSFWILMDPDGANAYSRVLFRKNGSNSTQWTDNLENASREAQGDYHSVGGACVMPMSANDYVELWNSGENPTYGTSYGNFSGFLVS